MSYLSTFLEHAIFSPSQPAWANYDDEQLINAYCNAHRAELGTDIHEWSSIQVKLKNKISNIKEIEKGVKTYIYQKYENAPEYRSALLTHMGYLPHEIYPTVKLFVNDSIGYRMDSEEKVIYSDLFWGKSDSIKFEDNLLRVFDLKTGSRQAKVTQLLVYSALYCLQEHIKPNEIEIETRIYQNGEVIIDNPPSDVVYDIMKDIVHKDTVVNKLRGGRP